MGIEKIVCGTDNGSVETGSEKINNNRYSPDIEKLREEAKGSQMALVSMMCAFLVVVVLLVAVPLLRVFV